jgi:hypothetical protein
MSQRSQDALERLSDGPIYHVHLDAGAFSWLMEILENKQRFQRSFEGYQRLVKRTLLSFQEAQRAETADVELPEPAQPRKRTIPRSKKPTSRSGKR